MTRSLCTLFALSLLLGGCERPSPSADPRTSRPPSGAYEITLSQLIPPFVGLSNSPHGTPTASVVGRMDRLVLEPSGHQSVMRIDNLVYVSAEFIATNHADTPQERLALLALGIPGARIHSALSAVQLGNAQAASDPFIATIHPTHALRLVDDIAGRRLQGRVGASDFVALAEEELPTLPREFEGTTLFPYGFWIGGGGRIEPGASARVTLAFTFPVGAHVSSSLERFTWHAQLVQLPHMRSVQAPQERHPSGWAATIARAQRMGGTQMVALGAGERMAPTDARCADLIALANVRIAGTDLADPHLRHLLPTSIAEPATFSGCKE